MKRREMTVMCREGAMASSKKVVTIFLYLLENENKILNLELRDLILC